MPRVVPPADSLLRVFAADLQKRRIARGLSQPDLADLSELSLSSIRAYEQALRAPSWDALVRLAWALDAKPTRLLSFLDAVPA